MNNGNYLTKVMEKNHNILKERMNISEFINFMRFKNHDTLIGDVIVDTRNISLDINLFKIKITCSIN